MNKNIPVYNREPLIRIPGNSGTAMNIIKKENTGGGPFILVDP
jgi:hypothetical protein